ncbi:MAG TPA: zinc ribbon domain-containing protein [Saprospiraceae bacterium]|nr:zinc ribbon domain-containing protein [Saprospiraceae bacterium]
MLIFIWICLGVIGAMISGQKGNNGCGGFALGILLGPIGLLMAFFSSDNEEAKMAKKGYTRKCPHCAEFVKSDANICKHCGSTLYSESSDVFANSRKLTELQEARRAGLITNEEYEIQKKKYL